MSQAGVGWYLAAPRLKKYILGKNIFDIFVSPSSCAAYAIKSPIDSPFVDEETET